jgi:hypothetical protein
MEHEHLTSMLESAPRSSNVVANPSTNDSLSAIERNELLRLRGQIGVLRGELRQETNRLARTSPAAPSGAR